MDFLGALNDALLALATSPWAVLAVFVVCVVDAFFPPIPSETMLVAAVATATAAGEPGMVAVFAATAALGAFLGDSTSYAIGRRIGTERWRWMRTRTVRASIGWAQGQLRTRTAVVLLVSRYIPGGRVAVTMTAGATRLPYRRFAPLSALACVSWAAVSTGLGALAGVWLEDLPLAAAAIGIVFALALGFVLDLILRRRGAAPTAPLTATLRTGDGTGPEAGDSQPAHPIQSSAASVPEPAKS